MGAALSVREAVESVEPLRRRRLERRKTELPMMDLSRCKLLEPVMVLRVGRAVASACFSCAGERYVELALAMKERRRMMGRTKLASEGTVVEVGS